MRRSEVSRFPQLNEASLRLLESAKATILEPEELDPALIGVAADGHAVYHYNSLVECFMKMDGTDRAEASEWVDYNTLRAIPYMPAPRPEVLGDADE